MVAESGDGSGASRTAGVQEPPTSGPDVFISYGSDDVAIAREMRSHLEQGGYRCWMAPDDVSGPETWAEQIVDAIGSCKVMVVLISSVANASNHVSKEVDLAFEHGKAVLPVRVEDVAPSGALRYLLALAQWIDAFPGPLGPHAEEVRRQVAAIVGTGSGVDAAAEDATTPSLPDESAAAEAGGLSARWSASPTWRKWLIGAAAAIIIAGVGLGIGLLLGGGDGDEPYSYGDDETLDWLWDRCAEGDMVACDELYDEAPYDTEYSFIGETCGERFYGQGECALSDEQGAGFTYGDNGELDQFWDACAGEDFDACRALYEMSPPDSEYALFGGTCGFRTEFLAECPPPE